MGYKSLWMLEAALSKEKKVATEESWEQEVTVAA